MSRPTSPLLAALVLVLCLPPAVARAADTEAPKIVHTALAEAAPGTPLKVTVEITDESEVFEPKLHFRTAGAKKFMNMSLMRVGGTTYSATIPDNAVTGDLEYFVEAYDAQGNGPARFASDVAPQRVKVNTAPPPAAPPEPEKAESAPAEAVANVESGAPFRPPLYSAGIAVAVGAVGAGVGGYFGSRVLDAKVGLSESNAAASAATTCFVVAGVAAAAGVALLVWHFVPAGDAAAAPSTELAIGPTGAFVHGTFY